MTYQQALIALKTYKKLNGRLTAQQLITILKIYIN